jgi:phosphoenolpyruvate carboxykinase (ATP)
MATKVAIKGFGRIGRLAFQAMVVFGFLVPAECPGVPPKLLDPQGTWSRPSDYDEQAKKLAELFQKNFAKFKDQSSKDVQEAGPRLG